MVEVIDVIQHGLGEDDKQGFVVKKEGWGCRVNILPYISNFIVALGGHDAGNVDLPVSISKTVLDLTAYICDIKDKS